MGLQSQLNDVSSDSIPLLFLALIAKSLDHLRSLLFSFIGIFRSHPPASSGRLGILAEQLEFNRALSSPYLCSAGEGGGSICIVCRSTLKDGEMVRKLECRHVFHKECFDGWLNHMKFSCLICRRSIVAEEQRVDSMWWRVREYLAEIGV